MIRKRLSEIVEPEVGCDPLSRAYDIFMIVVILLSLVPLMFRGHDVWLEWIERVSFVVFSADYLVRWLTADQRSSLPAWAAFLVFPFTWGAFIDGVSILPFVAGVVNPSVRMAKIMRLLRMLRIMRFFRYYESLYLVVTVIRKEGRMLLAVVLLACFYIFVTALIMFNVEGDVRSADGELMFCTFFDSVYWSACTLTTVGYGDICPVSPVGRVISMISAIVGVAIIALPSGIMTAGYMEALRAMREKKKENQADSGHAA